MKPWRTLAEERGADGQTLVLQERDGVFVIRVGGRELMSSVRHGSEEELARAAIEGAGGGAKRVLVGGLGLGYTLRAALDLLPADARVVVAELSPTVVAWNRGPLAGLAGAPLDDARVTVDVADVMDCVDRVDARRDGFDAILLDVDNGPSALANRGNDRLYGKAGLVAFRRALRPGGVVAIWSAGPAAGFVERLRHAGFEAGEREVGARGGAGKQGTRHVLFLGQRSRR